tara:strand:+ start:1310 stop:2302 length:993 start_codon:yes stop_codon:yes gene_type:complete
MKKQATSKSVVPFRLNRSELAVPGSRPEIFEKAAESDSDAIFLDLEDSVSVERKNKAREFILDAIRNLNWKNKTLSVRVNPIDTDFFIKDIEKLVGLNKQRLDLIMLPKVNSERDVLKLEKIVNQIEKRNKIEKKVGFELIIETAQGLINVNKIASSSKRIESLHFGAADFAASIGAKTMSIGGPHHQYGTLSPTSSKNERNFFLNDIWQVALFNIVVAAKAYGLRAIDCPYGDFNDNEGFEALAKSSYSLGFDGKMVIHPKQIKIANKIFMPTKKELSDAKLMLKAVEKSSKIGKGAIAFNGKLLDIVTIKQAKNIVQLYDKTLEKNND